ncbi:uncharacterized protein BP01DRAFT_63493 [Aspergillus saccharolyticus JOP 1030-1]|uniref:Uncharacterized protein n=1 Tax=Aspergillus saccharolyticus JOP 1030-1 TaxID=1450539 RepID=A0A318ZFB1_9EURO|nr:hypothetical protein BP01DRAFT_63493 [Aspergillus saccharolyticus JOP 1030-1]PYH44994.1 hypothetical protein BP01DRAFT_63493 [Aspergillus saccharolyticus JOP 1030-1]
MRQRTAFPLLIQPNQRFSSPAEGVTCGTIRPPGSAASCSPYNGLVITLSSVAAAPAAAVSSSPPPPSSSSLSSSLPPVTCFQLSQC